MSDDILIKRLEDCVSLDKKLIGNKAKNLLSLKNAGLLVPKSWIIESSVPASLLEEAGNYCNGVKLEDFQRAENYFVNELSSNVKMQLWNKVNHIIKKQTQVPLVVRSSGLIEDSEAYSFAGMFTTVINMKKVMNIVDSIVTIWAKSFTNGIYELCKRNNIASVEPCAVILQEMINSKIGGVTFRDQQHIYINSTFGLTKAVVDGATEPDQWVFDRDGCKLLSKTIGTKEYGVYPIYSKVNPSQGEKFCVQVGSNNYYGKTVSCEEEAEESVIRIELPETLRKGTTFTENKIKELLDCFMDAGQRMGFDTYDIEWCINQKDQLYFLQIRKATKNVQANNMRKRSALPLVHGYVQGKVEYVASNEDAKRFNKGSILLAKCINGAVLHASIKAIGCILESSSVLSHSAIIARELGIPCIGIKSLEMVEKDNLYEINGTTGEYVKLSTKQDDAPNITGTLRDYLELEKIGSSREQEFFSELLLIPSEWR